MPSKQRWGPWRNLGEIDAGGQGCVFKVEQTETHQIGALKRLSNPKRLDRFRKEIVAARKLNHPSIVPLIDVNVEVEPYYAVYEYEPGGSLGDLPVEELRAVAISQRLAWCEDICAALHAAHEASCVHRDVKPKNILLSLDRKKARLCDFGLVFLDEDGTRATATMEQVGSRYYIPPECEAGRAEVVSRRSDLYSIGKVLYYVASGGVVFAREMQRQPQYDLATRTNDPYLEAVAQIVDKVVTDTPDKRLDTALELQNCIAGARDRIVRRLPCAGAEKTYRCVFCGVGFYRQVCVSSTGHNEGYKEGNLHNAAMVFLECGVCGNCQRFKLKYGGETWFPAAHRTWLAER